MAIRNTAEDNLKTKKKPLRNTRSKSLLLFGRNRSRIEFSAEVFRITNKSDRLDNGDIRGSPLSARIIQKK